MLTLPIHIAHLLTSTDASCLCFHAVAARFIDQAALARPHFSSNPVSYRPVNRFTMTLSAAANLVPPFLMAYLCP